MRRARLCLVYVIVLLTLGASFGRNVISGSTQMAAAGIKMKRDVDPALRISLNSTILEQQPETEVQNALFTTQPKLRLKTDTMPFTSDNETINILCAEVNLVWSRPPNDTDDVDSEEEDARLFGQIVVNFTNGWANFSNLGITLMGRGYTLEFLIRSKAGENDTHEWRLTSRPFVVVEYPLQVHVSDVVVKYCVNETFTVSMNVSLWDFLRATMAQADMVNNTEWRYMVSLRPNGSPNTRLVGETTGSFLLGSNRMEMKFNLTTFGYRFQFNVTIDSPAYRSRIENFSAPFDAILQYDIQDRLTKKLTLTFNGSLDDENVTKDAFIVYFLNDFGLRYFSLRWHDPIVQNESSDSIVITTSVEGRTEDLNKTEHHLWEKAQSGHNLTVRDVTFPMLKKLMVNGQPYEGGPIVTAKADDYKLYGFKLPTLFTIVLMSFLSASFVIAVLLWQIRERRVMESYNKRIKAQRRQNGHVNTAYDSSNESVLTRARQEVYLIAMNERARVEREREQQQEQQQQQHNHQQQQRRSSRGCSAEDAPLRRCSSGGISRYKYYRRVTARLGSDDEDVLGAISGGGGGGGGCGGPPLDDDTVFADIERFEPRHDFAEVFYSPSHKRRPTFSSMTSSVHDEYYLRDAPGPSSRYMHRTNRGKCSITASTASGSLCSLPNTSSRSVSKVMVNSTSGDMNAYALPRPPSGHWSTSRDDKHSRMCNGKGLTPSSSAVC